MIVGGIERPLAIKQAGRLHRKNLTKLLRPGSELLSSLETWLKKFATDEVTNDVALEAYKQGMRDLENVKSTSSPERLRALGEFLVARAAERAALLP